MATQTEIYQLYLAYFGRPPDFTGLNSFGSASVAQVQAAFSASAESRALLGNSDVATQVNNIYVNLFGRNAEIAGLSYWVGEIASGRVTLASAAFDILKGARNEDFTTVGNRIAVAEAFVANYLSSPALALGYVGDAAAAQARTFLRTVTDTAASRAAALTGVPAAVTATVAAGAASASTSSGSTFTLTAGADARIGGNGADTFDGASNITTAVTATLQGFDNLDGGAGRDSLVLNQGAVTDGLLAGVRNTERVITTGDVTLGSLARAAGVDEVVTNGGTLTLGAGYTTDALSFRGSLTAADVVNVDNAAAGTNFRVTFTSAEVGDGSATESGAVTGQDRGLAVRLQREDGNDGLTGGVGRFEDEGIVFRSADTTARFDVRDISGTARGTFNIAALGTAGAETITNAAGGGFALNSADVALYINAGGGNDSVTAGNGNDFLVGGSGDDTITGANGNNSVIGGAGNDIISGGTGNDSLNAGDGNDSITAGAGNDNVDAGAGDDVVVIGGNLTADDTLVGGDGRDTLAVTTDEINTAANAARATGFEVLRADAAATLRADRVAGITELVSNVAGAVVFTNVGATQTLRMTEAATNNLTATLATNTTADAGTLALGATTATGTTGTAAGTVTLADYETLAISSTGGTTAAVNSITALTAAAATAVTVTGDRQLTLTAFTGSDALRTLNGSAMTANLIMGAALVATGNHTLSGGSGNDTLRGGAGNDAITAGAGNDSVVAGAGNDSVDAGAGNDTVDISAGGNNTVSGGDGNDSVTGGAGNDVISGGAGNDTINGAAGNDNIDAGEGDDRILVASWAEITANDTINGGAGNDTLVTNDATVTLNSVATGGISGIEVIELNHNNAQTVTITDAGIGAFGNAVTIVSQRTAAGATTINASGVLSSVTRVTFTGNDLVDNYTVGNGIDVASLGDAADSVSVATLTSLQTTDTLAGGAGADTLSFTDTTGGTVSISANVTGFETINVNTGAGGNYVFTLTDAIAAANRATATGALTVSRNAADTGTLRVNGEALAAATALVLTGAAGADTLTGGAGNDTVTGGAGADSLTGGAGNDRFVVANGDLAVGEVIAGGDGTDTVALAGTNSTAGVTLSGIEVFEFANSATLNASAGAFSAQTFTLAGAGTPDGTARLVLDATGSQTVNLSGLVIANGTTPAGLVAFDGAIVTNFGATADVFIGSAGRESVSGGDGADILQGGAGNDTINGQAGNDTVTGGAGNDTFVFDQTSASSDSVTDFTGAGTTAGDVIDFAGGLSAFGSGSFVIASAADATVANGVVRVVANNTFAGTAAIASTFSGDGAGSTATDAAIIIANDGASVANIYYAVNSGGDAAFESVTLIGTLNGVSAATLVAGDFV